MDKIFLGSQTARNGFANEKDIADKFNFWQSDSDAQKWLTLMNYSLLEIKKVKAVVISGHKADINVQINIELQQTMGIENIQVKLVSNKTGFNQIDKRWVDTYTQMWNIPNDIQIILKYFTGELKPIRNHTKSNKRMFLDKFDPNQQQALLQFFDTNKILILSDILQGRGQFSAEWVLVAQKLDYSIRWVLQPIAKVLNHYLGDGTVHITPKGSLKIGLITMQRKGGDGGGRPTANMLQFKCDPTELFGINNNKI